MIELEGVLEHITYHNEDNHYTVARLSTGKPQKKVTIIGFMTGISPGQRLLLSGKWETHAKYGQQFKVASFKITLPETIEQRREVFQAWKDADASAQAEADRRYPPDRNLKRNLNYMKLQVDRKKLDIAHKFKLQPPDLRRIVLEGNFKGW